jgi:hypothetical protein
MRSHGRLALALIPLIAFAQPAASLAEDEELPQADAYEDAPAPSPAQQAELGRARAAKAESSFDAIMRSNATPAAATTVLEPPSPTPVHLPRYKAPDLDATPGATNPEPPSVANVPLDRYQKVVEEQSDQAEKASRPQAPPVTLGAAEYKGEARHHALALTVTLSVTLGAPGRWKTVPLLGDDAVLVSAKVGNTAIPTSRRDGFHVWVTTETGERTITLEVLSPARGPRGSIEYDLVVDRTPVTHFACRFPAPGLEPRVDDAVLAQVASTETDTTLDATVKPTTRLHLVGFRDFGEGTSSKAKVYAESLTLLSVEESSFDVFAVIRYTILYGGAKDFQVLVPPGMQVVSADGEGAFTYALEKQEDGTLIRGETAYPIRNSYEISLRLHRNTPRGSGPSIGESFPAPLPRTQNVEREDGWLGVEVPGQLRLEEEKREEALPVDVRQLPEEMVQSAVSPILLAYRYHSGSAHIALKATRLPERTPSSASIDRLRATSVVASEGQVLSEINVTLRNRLRHSLEMQLPEGSRVLSTLLDGEPVKPSLDDHGHLLLPLRRSAGADRPKPFVLQVVLEKAGDPLDGWGRPELLLPSFDLPVSSMQWTVYLPANNRYGALTGDVGAQSLSGEGTWTSAPVLGGGIVANGREASGASGEANASADTGAMPVRIKLPESGVRLDHTRYWLEANQKVGVHFRYLRTSLLAPLAIIGVVLAALGLVLLVGGPARQRALGAVLTLACAWPLTKLGGSGAWLAVVALAVGMLSLRSRGSARWAGLAAWFKALPARWRNRPAVQRTGLQKAGRLGLSLGLLWLGANVLINALDLAILLLHPL